MKPTQLKMKMPTNEQDAQQDSTLFVRELWGIVVFATAILLSCALFSYSSGDVPFGPNSTGGVGNWIGPGGAFVSRELFLILGLGAFVCPFLLLGWSIVCFLPNPPRIGAMRGWGIGLVFLFGLVLLEQFNDVLPKASYRLGGLFGYVVEFGLASALSTLGAGIVSAAGLIVGAVMLTGLRLSKGVRTGMEKLPGLSQLPTLPLLVRKPSSVTVPPPPPHPSVRIAEPRWDSSPSEKAVQGILQIVERDITHAKKVVEQADKEGKVLSQEYQLPPLRLLDYDAPTPVPVDEDKMRVQAQRLTKTFGEFGIEGSVREIRPGPVVTTFEFVPAPGIKLSRIAALADDMAMAMEAIHVRIVAPIPGKGAVGIEVPNEHREMVFLKEIVADPDYRKRPHKLCMAIGKGIEGTPYFVNLADMPHVLIAGTTGSGKSVAVNAMICSILYRATPNDVRFLMIDPKMLELSIYEGIPHLLLPPIIDSKKAAVALRWAVKEMERRYLQMNEMGVRDIEGYNAKVPQQKLPYIVIVVDEYADMVAVAGKDVELLVMRLAQKARASGIHVMLATQRPSVDIITGVIKANFPVRMSFRLASSHDSKTIVNRPGAEKLLGRGDMLVMPPGTSDLIRIHGAYVSEKELMRVVDFWQAQAKPEYDMSILASQSLDGEEGDGADDVEDGDDRYHEAVAIVTRTGKCSTSWLQRQMGVGYNRAARMVERMERESIVGPIQNAKGDREIFRGQSNESQF